ncbi:hypothetical protein HG263_08095 [Pseudoalteromonas sp. JBTF-M23]|uniref:Uncharacterized protein n=1 Tax=Pseudoalteromonas caenipelagi TaxID=2726988 RepID=A0A849VCH9_9GAMM|nr:hypothetical protein [Pseudoalteromonas caenipelagi]NOU50500.1 hypothetical protein [Pseudoalteromonas caenipelagi]
MREFEVEKVLKESLENTPVGEKITLNFSGVSNIIDVEMTFKGGWVVTQTIIPGKPFEFTKGEDGYLTGINITINPFDGLKNV